MQNTALPTFSMYNQNVIPNNRKSAPTHNLNLISIILKKRFARVSEKTVNITSGSSILTGQNIALIDNFDVMFLEICLLLLICFYLKTKFLSFLNINSLNLLTV